MSACADSANRPPKAKREPRWRIRRNADDDASELEDAILARISMKHHS